MPPPLDMKEAEKLLHFKQAVCVLVDAPLRSYHTLRKALLSLGVLCVSFDPAIFLFCDGTGEAGHNPTLAFYP